MQINFEEQTPKGLVEFNGELTKEEVEFLLRYALLSLLTRGMLPSTIVVKYPNEEPVDDFAVSFDVPDKDKLN